MWLLYGVLIWLGLCLGFVILGIVLGNVLGYLEYIKEEIPDIFILNKEKRKNRRIERKMNKLMEYSIPELYKYFTQEQREYCSEASSAEEYCRRYHEVVLQDPDIVRAYFDTLRAEVEEKNK